MKFGKIVQLGVRSSILSRASAFAATPSHRRLADMPLSEQQIVSVGEPPLKATRGHVENLKGQAAAGSGPVLRIAKLSERAHVPIRGTEHSAGLDLCSAYDYVVPARGRALCKTDLAVAVPAGCYGRVAPRSGLAVKRGIDVGAGVVDADYRGNLGVVLFNFGTDDFEVKAGDRIAQLVCERIVMPDVVECDQLEESARGAGGFGSTGK